MEKKSLQNITKIKIIYAKRKFFDILIPSNKNATNGVCFMHNTKTIIQKESTKKLFEISGQTVPNVIRRDKCTRADEKDQPRGSRSSASDSPLVGSRAENPAVYAQRAA
ncbi:hypothetical protein NPIL_639491 [Nephila pilipes]|uniref:Uncharacterized protein n=1 Tax=Nephila pilipes TaxID=299642 RepID=A0A8X6Q000_NEPPI|nr:hypothetical protein NPIL_639491 [Nephila pilipes]